ncbi:amino acid ABC transporter permease [Cupriavidus agavae]|uniref:Amino acid ABC transporter permease n=1 Tax=Cupriavidus agavae TaxID=1001822 RepID=A0A4Q7RE23_9BURK|nr:amino acid ABC transporter permease [Cupriavidus agavae]RZT31413.1 hypothetical protein EV147_4594 [Cupriavidus agavae]
MQKIIATAIALGLAATSVAAVAQDKKSFDPYSQGAKAGEKFDTYSQGAKSGDKFDPYSQGANKSTRADLTDQSAAPKKPKAKKETKKAAPAN